LRGNQIKNYLVLAFTVSIYNFGAMYFKSCVVVVLKWMLETRKIKVKKMQR